MNKSDRLKIIKRTVELHHFPSVESFIEDCIIDELMYAGLKTDVISVFNKVLQAYSFDDYIPSQRIVAYISHYSAHPKLAAMQHVEINDHVSYIGEYYDGVPTNIVREKGRFEIVPITIE